MNIIKKARLFATVAHAAIGQRRKYTNEPYIVHPEEVAKLVTRYGGTENQIAAAWLHDVVEDTNITEDLIHQEFGDDIASLVCCLTDVSVPYKSYQLSLLIVPPIPDVPNDTIGSPAKPK